MPTGTSLLYGDPEPRVLADPMESFKSEYPLMWADSTTDDGNRLTLVVASHFFLDIDLAARSLAEVRRETIPALTRWKELLGRMELAYKRHWETGLVYFEFDRAQVLRAARAMTANPKEHGNGARLAGDLLKLVDDPGARQPIALLRRIIQDHSAAT